MKINFYLAPGLVITVFKYIKLKLFFFFFLTERERENISLGMGTGRREKESQVGSIPNRRPKVGFDLNPEIMT